METETQTRHQREHLALDVAGYPREVTDLLSLVAGRSRPLVTAGDPSPARDSSWWPGHHGVAVAYSPHLLQGGGSNSSVHFGS